MNDAPDLIRRFVENREQLSDAELEMLVAVLRTRPDLAIELKDQLILDELLAQKLDLTRWHFLPQVDQRIRDEAEGFSGIETSDLVQKTIPARPEGDARFEPRTPGAAARLASEDVPSAETGGRRLKGLLALVLIAALGAAGTWIYDGRDRIGVIESAAGEVQLVRHDSRVPAAKSAVIRSADRLVTSVNSSALVRYPDGTVLKIDAGTAAAFYAPGGAVPGKRVFVTRGRIAADVAPQPIGKPMTFESVDATAEVLGTTLSFLVAPQQTRVTVTEGQVRVRRTIDRESLIVSKDQFAVVTTNTLASAHVGWPSDRRGLIFLFETNDQPNLVRSISTGMNRSFSLRPRGRAHLDHDYAMVLTGGAFLAEDVDGEILTACRQTNQLSIEATVRPSLAKQAGPARIVTFSTNVVDRDFTLGQVDDNLIVRIRTPITGPNGVDGVENGLPVCKLAADQFNHVIVSYKPGRIVCYLNGQLVFDGNQIEGDFSGWTAQHLLFGDEYAGERNWAGSLEGVAIYNRFVEPDEAGRNALQYEHLRQSRTVVPQLRVRAELVAKSTVPTAAQIQPHRSALMMCKYRITDVLEGRIDQSWLLVAQWALLDRQDQPIVKQSVGTETELLLEPFERNPQAQRYLYSDDFPFEEGGERFLEIRG
ncbi:MAG TPA: LamG-like jellyroll fold domain-containing protein [Planctomycetaceae bacterium]|jgi:hypothetical protein